MRHLCHLLIGLGCLCGLLWTNSATAQAQTNRYVSPGGIDSGTCTNRAAPCATIQFAHDQAGAGDVIVIAAGVYTENVRISQSVTLQGADAATTIVDGGQGAGRVIEIGYTPASTVTIAALTLRNGRGGVITGRGPTAIVNCRIDHNNATGEFYDEGGGLYLFGITTIDNTAIYANAGQYGGGVYARAAVTITASAVYSNTAEMSGGGVYIGIDSGDNRAILRNSTVSRNQAATAGGVDAGSAGTELTLQHATIAHNHAAAGSNAPGALSLATGVKAMIANTILANNQGSSQCNSGFNVTSLGGNLSSDASCGFTSVSDHINVDPLLAPLQDNGGATWTHALLGGSPALDAGVAAQCLPTDQRGALRPQGDGCDSGAFERSGETNIFLPLIAS